jgi:hypothetical protein
MLAVRSSTKSENIYFCVIFIFAVIICELIRAHVYKRCTVNVLKYPESVCCALYELRFSVTFIPTKGCVLPNYVKFDTSITCLNVFQK